MIHLAESTFSFICQPGQKIRTENRTMFRVLHVFPINLPDCLCTSSTSLPGEYLIASTDTTGCSKTQNLVTIPKPVQQDTHWESWVWNKETLEILSSFFEPNAVIFQCVSTTYFEPSGPVREDHGSTHLREEAKLSRRGQHAREVLIEEIDQLAVVTPHQLSHRLRQEGSLFESLERGTDHHSK